MNAAPVIILVVVTILYFIRFKARDGFLWVYGLFFLILLVYASNKELYGLSVAWYEGGASPLSLFRWLLLIILALYAARMKIPEAFTFDSAVITALILLICIMAISTIYADSFEYSMMRVISVGLLLYAVIKGLSLYLYRSVNCIKYFRFHYIATVIVLLPLILVYLMGGGYGVTLIMGQYAGFFGNQNMFGVFSALCMPYVLFHRQAITRSRLSRILDTTIIALIFIGLWYSGSRNGMISGTIAIIVYLFVVSLKNRMKIIACGLSLIAVFLISPTLEHDVLKFIRKGTDKTANVVDLSSQILEERRYEIWAGVWPLFLEKKLTGYGFASSHLQVHPFTKDKEAGRTVHNSYLEIFGDLGIPGFVLLLFILFRSTANAVKLGRDGGEYLERNINAVFIAGFAAGSFNALFESWMFSAGILSSLMYWGFVAGLAGRWAVLARIPHVFNAKVQKNKNTKLLYDLSNSGREVRHY